MRDINNEAAEIKHVFLLLESRRESSLFLCWEEGKGAWGLSPTFQTPHGNESA